jgi:hypothetical protein
MSECPKYTGRYAGTVLNNVDPEFRGRLLVTVPDVLKVFPSTWAEPVMALGSAAGTGAGVYMVPAVGAGVWVEFRDGDPNYPVWNGCRVNSAADLPPLVQLGAPVSPPVVIQSVAQQMLMISDTPMPLLPFGGILLSTGSSYIRLDKTGVTIFGTKVNINGVTVDFNGGALTVLGPPPPG